MLPVFPLDIFHSELWNLCVYLSLFTPEKKTGMSNIYWETNISLLVAYTFEKTSHLLRRGGLRVLIVTEETVVGISMVTGAAGASRLICKESRPSGTCLEATGWG